MGPKSGPPKLLLPVFFVGQVVLSLISTSLLVFVFGGTALRVNWQTALFLGIPFSQVTVLAAWNALGDSQRFLRPIGSIVWLVLIWLICFGIPDVTFQNPPGMVVPGMAMFAQWILVQIPLWFVRLKFGWRLGTIDEHAGAGASRSVQFGIRHLLIWMTIVGVILGIARLVLRTATFHGNEASGFSIFLICNSLFAWSSALSSVLNYRLLWALGAAAGLTVIISLVEPYVFTTLIGTLPRQRSLFWNVNCVQFVWISGSMLILRQFGFRLVRVRDSL